MSKLETNTIDTVSGTTNLVIGSTNTSTIALGASGDTVTVPNGALTGQNYPAFEAYQSSSQTPGNNVWTKLTLTSETFDTDSAYDTTNSKFTIPSGKAGKYFFVLEAGGYDSSTTLNIFRLGIYKNGSSVKINTALDTDATSVQTYFATMTALLDLSAGDYIEAYINPAYGGTFTTLHSASGTQTRFVGYRIGA